MFEQEFDDIRRDNVTKPDRKSRGVISLPETPNINQVNRPFCMLLNTFLCDNFF
jgi:hypothetical protein